MWAAVLSVRRAEKGFQDSVMVKWTSFESLGMRRSLYKEGMGELLVFRIYYNSLVEHLEASVEEAVVEV